MSIKQIIANFWHEMHQETGEIPTNIFLPTKSFDKLKNECGGDRVPEPIVIYLTHTDGKTVMVTRDQTE